MTMGMRMRRRTRQLAFVTVAVPVAAWALEQGRHAELKHVIRPHRQAGAYARALTWRSDSVADRWQIGCSVDRLLPPSHRSIPAG
jgi:hypothetical protein